MYERRGNLSAQPLDHIVEDLDAYKSEDGFACPRHFFRGLERVELRTRISSGSQASRTHLNDAPRELLWSAGDVADEAKTSEQNDF
ncbi:unnamed protein product [Heligmosomoides polygyrus]|uniref:Uncharacterized protein n=1 Tax=Heligmosomoides polygyrus TaxID=6339 RepID=A0A183GJL0_HELPZ|nr:unnamed protein product [Heligmosomoides polygyrus]